MRTASTQRPGRGEPGYQNPNRGRSPHQAFEQALLIVGGSAEMARRLGVVPSAVQKWAQLGRIPAKRVLAIERATEARVTRYELRPDLYPRNP